MADLYASLGSDRQRHDEGVWTNFGIYHDCEFLIAGAHSQQFVIESIAFERASRLKKDETQTERTARYCRMLARAKLLAFRGKVEWRGESIEDSEDSRTMVLVGSPTLCQLVENFSNDFTHYRLEHDEEALGNSERPSPGDEGQESRSNGSGASSQQAA